MLNKINESKAFSIKKSKFVTRSGFHILLFD